jgi:protocatechuate 3,4-dioxygenase beta subunit
VLDENGRPVPNTMIEIVQANACGRYAHNYDQHDAPLDPNFTGVGRVISDAEGRYRFVTIKPGAYPGATIPMPGARPTSTSRCSARPSSPAW